MRRLFNGGKKCKPNSYRATAFAGATQTPRRRTATMFARSTAGLSASVPQIASAATMQRYNNARVSRNCDSSLKGGDPFLGGSERRAGSATLALPFSVHDRAFQYLKPRYNRGVPTETCDVSNAIRGARLKRVFAKHVEVKRMKRVYLKALLIALLLFFLLAWEFTPTPANSEPNAIAQAPSEAVQHQENTYVPSNEASLIADAIYGAEGRCDHLHGESGEYGCYQYLPSTWQAYSTEVAGAVLPHTQENERYVTVAMVQSWLDEGKTARWIFLQWNQGNGDGWGGGTDCYAGVNKWGVAYDSCAYAAKALALLAAEG